MMISVASGELGDFIDLGRYPIDQLDSSLGKQLIEKCHRMVANDTICVLPGFLKQAAVDWLCREITALEFDARKINHLSTPYGWMDNTGFAKDHPRSKLLRRHCSVLTTDQLDQGGQCMGLYHLDELTEFIRRLLQFDTLYRTACPNLSVQINVMGHNDEFGWHFDTNDGAVSFIIQNADEGGEFELQPLIRSEQDENYQAVGRVLDGIDQPKKPALPAGTFTLFMGRRSVHRVANVGKTTKNRQSLLFSYDRNPGMVFPEKTRRRFTAPTLEPYLGALTAET